MSWRDPTLMGTKLVALLLVPVVLLAGCSSSPGGGGSPSAFATRLLVGQIAPTAGLDFSEMSVLYLTRGDRYAFSALDPDGNFTLTIPTVRAAGALVLVREEVLASDSQGNPTRAQLVLVAQLVADELSGEALMAFEPGADNLLLGPTPDATEPLAVDLAQGLLTLSQNPSEGVVFEPGPYGVADLCADSLATSCAFADLFFCDPGPCEDHFALGAIISECDPCGSAEGILGPFGPVPSGTISFEIDRGQGTLPDLLVPYPGLAILGVLIRVPPVEQGGRMLPATYLNLGAQPGIFYSDFFDPTTYRFAFEDGERVSADDLFAIELPELPDGSPATIEIRYRTTLGTVVTLVCAADNEDPDCSEASF